MMKISRKRRVLLAAVLLSLAFTIPVSAQSDPPQNGNGNCTGALDGSLIPCWDQSPQSSASTPRNIPDGSNNQTTRQPDTGSYRDTERISSPSTGMDNLRPSSLAPEPLTEFQKFVASTTGEVLKVYGSQLFRAAPSTFAPLDMSPVPSDFVMGPGDELRIRVWGQVSFEANLRVDRSGELYLPHVGPVHVAGLSFSELDSHLRSAISRIYRNFDLTVDLGQIRAIQIYLTGQTRRPGVFTVSSLSTLVDALFASGGPSSEGSLRHIQVRRRSQLLTDFDLYDLLTKGDKSKDVKLEAGDIIFIPPVGPQVAVTGSVRNPAIYELRGPESLAGLLADTGGVSTVASQARISIERIEEHRDRQSMEVAYDAAGLATPLEDGDLVHVYSMVPGYRKTVTLRGNIANPGRFAWHPGMRVSELIPDKDSLMTRNYWWRRTRMGLPAPEFELEPNTTGTQQPGQSLDVTNQSYSQPDNQFNRQPVDSRQSQDLRGERNGKWDVSTETSNSSLASQQSSIQTTQRGTAQPTEIRILSPEIDWDYAAIERLDPVTLKTTLVPFDLGKLVMQHDASQDLELQAGDVVSLFSEADIRLPVAQQTKLVKLDGEFAHGGTYTAKPGETLRELVDRAGGFTPNAYLYGSEFARESTRVIQQARIDEYVRSLQSEMERGNLAMAASSTASPQDLLSANGAQASEQQLIARMRQVRATGRIVLEFKPGTAGSDMVPDVPLEDGDSFIVPSIPASINVVGAVYDQNSFLYNRTRSVGTYLRMAGGPNRSADKNREFVIRADGEVVGREGDWGPWNDGFSKLKLNPGDTVVVPDKGFKPSALRGVVDWSQMFSQFALGAAALSVLK